ESEDSDREDHSNSIQKKNVDDKMTNLDNESETSSSEESDEDEDSDREDHSNGVQKKNVDDKKTNLDDESETSSSEESDKDTKMSNLSEKSEDKKMKILDDQSEIESSSEESDKDNKNGNLNDQSDAESTTSEEKKTDKKDVRNSSSSILTSKKRKSSADDSSDSNNQCQSSPTKKINAASSISIKQTGGLFIPSIVQKNKMKKGKAKDLTNNGMEQLEKTKNGFHQSRVNFNEIKFNNEKLKDNSAIGSFGYKAYNDFATTRGKDFRAQKTKKKRGSYRGGKIDFQSHSIKFEDNVCLIF
ncbi:10860_t:CDS:2, partial [Scutellospora calospora]